jgi:hypothetical protein
VPFCVAPGGAQDVTVRFAPSGLGDATGELQIASNDPDESSVAVPLAGEGTAAPAANSAARIRKRPPTAPAILRS